jgi:RHS repeat-associated protein
LEAYAKYVDPNTNNWTTALTVLMSQVSSGAAAAVVDGAGYSTVGNTPFPFAGLNGTSGSSGKGPKAYLNWLVFDRNFILKTGGYVKMSDVAKENGSNVPHERLAKELIIQEPGYVYMYLSNEETTPVEVYFDDVSVTLVNGPVIHQSDYDPFGLTFNDYSRENEVPNSFLYNGKELQKDFDLNWYDYGARMYDAALGRWHVIDPKAEKYAAWSPYNYVMNNPVKFVDPDGRDIVNYKNDAASKEDNIPLPSPEQIIKTLLSVPEGQRIMSDAKNNKNVKVYYAIRDLKTVEKVAPDVVAETRSLSSTGIHTQDLLISGKTLVKVDKGDPFDIFNGLDISDAIKNRQRVRLIVVGATFVTQESAFALGHEVDAHVNIEQNSVYSGIDPAGYEHEIFGGNAGPRYGANRNPHTKKAEGYIKNRSDFVPGSPADNLANQLLPSFTIWLREVFDKK